MAKLTYEESLELKLLSGREGEDWDTYPLRTLINTGLAERFGTGMVRITDAGRAALAVVPEERNTTSNGEL